MIRNKMAALTWRATAGVLIGIFFLFQLATIDYGTRINDVPFVAESPVAADRLRNSSLDRDIVVSAPPDGRESLDLWLLRYKLYPTESDEVVNVLALARVKPSQGQFDLGFYQYGGAYLYPLGAWLYGLNSLGILDLGPLEKMLESPQRMDRVWIFGRLFVLLAFTGSAVLFFSALRMLAPPRAALMLLALYLFCPASIMYSAVMKPHWYALLWISLAIFLLVRGVNQRRIELSAELLLGIALGLAVGSALTFSVFAVIIWVALAILVLRDLVSSAALIRVPVSAATVFALTNPYYFLNWRGVVAERAVAAEWFRPSVDPWSLALFVDNSLLTGLGVALAGAIGAAAAAACFGRRADGDMRLAIAAIFLPWIATAALTANMATWHVNIRYAAYTLPVGLLFLSVSKVSKVGRAMPLGAVLIATLVQMAPLKLAYLDENSARRSTRLSAAAWIDTNIAPGSSICLNTMTPVPYDVPPFRLDRYALNVPECEWRVVVERETDSLVIDPAFTLAERFRPRLSPERFPLVFGHINPQISIYRRG